MDNASDYKSLEGHQKFPNSAHASLCSENKMDPDRCLHLVVQSDIVLRGLLSIIAVETYPVDAGIRCAPVRRDLNDDSVGGYGELSVKVEGLHMVGAVDVVLERTQADIALPYKTVRVHTVGVASAI